MTKDVCIIGAGIGGLTLAHLLEQQGKSCIVLEASGRVGGMIRSERRGGFLIEHGPNSSLGKGPMLNLAKMIGLSDSIVYPQPGAKRRYLAVEQTDGLKLIQMPRSLRGVITSPVLSAGGKLRLLRDTFASRTRADDESVQEFMTRRVGPEFTRRIIAPLLGGIWAADISKLSCRSALPFAWNLEESHRSLAWGILRERVFRSYRPREPRPTLLSFREGMESFPLQLARRLKTGTLFLNSAVTAIDLQNETAQIAWQSSGESDERITARTVVLACPSDAAASLLEPIMPELTQAIRQIPYAPLGLLHLGVSDAQISHPLDGFGFLVPPSANTPLLGVIFSSSLFPGRAPAGQHLLTCFAGGATKPDLADVTDSTIQRALIDELRNLLGISGTPTVLNTTLYTRSIPNFPVGHFRLQDALKRFQERHPQLRILANWESGISVPDRIQQASELANQIGERRIDDGAGQSQIAA